MESVHPRLLAVISAVDDWCNTNDVQYDMACDESDIQGFKLFQKNTRFINSLIEYVNPFLDKNKVHLEYQKVRGGTIITLSLEAISETKLCNIIKRIGEEVEIMSFADRISHAINSKPIQAIPEEKTKKYKLSEQELLKHANKIIKCGSDQDFDDNEAKKSIKGKRIKQAGGATLGANKGANKGAPLRFEEFKIPQYQSRRFKSELNEALDGIATPTDEQPQDLFSKFARALTILGDQMGTGPLQNVLKKQGINWKKSEDGQNIILYVINSQTNAQQPIATINAKTLESPNDFQEQLTIMLDFAKGEAPGAFKQRQQELQDQDKAVRSIAQSVSPQDDQDGIAQQMNAGASAATNAGVPKINV